MRILSTKDWLWSDWYIFNTLANNFFDLKAKHLEIITNNICYRSSHRRCSVKKGVLRFHKIHRKTGDLWHRCFSMNFAEFLRTLQKTNTRLLLMLIQGITSQEKILRFLIFGKFVTYCEPLTGYFRSFNVQCLNQRSSST